MEHQVVVGPVVAHCKEQLALVVVVKEEQDHLEDVAWRAQEEDLQMVVVVLILEVQSHAGLGVLKSAAAVLVQAQVALPYLHLVWVADALGGGRIAAQLLSCHECG